MSDSKKNPNFAKKGFKILNIYLMGPILNILLYEGKVKKYVESLELFVLKTEIFRTFCIDVSRLICMCGRGVVGETGQEGLLT